MSSRKNDEMTLLKVTARYIKVHHPEKCNDFRVFSREPLFRGMAYGIEQFGITQDEIEKEICDDVLRIQRPAKQDRGDTLNMRPVPVQKTHMDQYFKHVLKPNADEIARLPPDQRAKVVNMWASYQLGLCEGYRMKFYSTYSAIIDSINRRVIETENSHKP